MNEQPTIGTIVGVYKTGLAGEVTKVISHGLMRKFHVKVPVENETYLYTEEDLYVFPDIAANNIRKEWENSTEIQEINRQPSSSSFHLLDRLESGKGGVIDKLKFMFKVF